MLGNTQDSWGSIAKAFHWTIALIMIMQLAAGTIMVNLPPTPVKMGFYDLHKSTGVIIYGLVLFRLMWRLGSVVPVQPLALKPYYHYLAKLGSAVLYAFMIIMPVSGFIMSDAAAKPVTLYYLYTLPHFFAKNANLSQKAWLIHHYAGYGLTGVLVLHLGAAMYHHYILKNNLLARMLPAKICRYRKGQSS